MDLNSNPDQSKAESNPIQSQMSKGKRKAVEKPDGVKRKMEKRRRSDQHETLSKFLQTKKEMMAKSDEKDRL